MKLSLLPVTALSLFVPSLALAQAAESSSPTESVVTTSVSAEAAAPSASAAESTSVAPTSAALSNATSTNATSPSAAPSLTSDKPADAAPAALPNAGYDDKFFIQSSDGRFRLTFQSAMQARFTMTGFEDTTDKATGADTGDQWMPAFSIPRLRITFEGNMFTKDLTYKAQFELGNAATALRDAFLDYRIFGQLHVRAGQDMKPFSREQLSGFRRQQFVDRSVIDFEMGNKKGGNGGTGRDIGLLFHNDYLKTSGFEWAAGIYNGRGIAPWYAGTDTVNTLAPAAAAPVVVDPKGNTVIVNNNTPMRGDRFNPQFVARVGYNNGIKGYSFSDLEGGGFRYGIAASGMVDADVDGSDQNLAAGRKQHDSKARAEIDAIIKYKGFSAFGAYYIGSRQAGTDWGTREWELNAAQAQAGYVIGDLVEPVIRWAQIEEWDSSVVAPAPARTRTINDYTAGLNLFFHGHQAKIATDFTIETNDYSDGNSAPVAYEFRSQAQVFF